MKNTDRSQPVSKSGIPMKRSTNRRLKVTGALPSFILALIVLSWMVVGTDDPEVAISGRFHVPITIPPFGLPTVEATIGDRTGTFLVDTGAETSVIDPRFARETGISGVGVPMVVRAVHSYGIRPVVTLDGELQLEDAVVSGVEWIVINLRKLPFLGELDGVLGRDVLRHGIIVLEGDSRRGSFADPITFLQSTPEGFARFESVAISEDARVALAIQGNTWRTLVDTGFTRGISLRGPTDEFDVLMGEGPPSSYDALGRSRTGSVLLASVARLGGYEIPDMAVEKHTPYSASRRQALMGVDFFRDATVVISLSDKTMWFRFDEDARFDRLSTTAMQAAVYHDGRTVRRSDTFRFVIEEIDPINPLHTEFGVRAGDEIVTVDGVTMIDTSESEYVDPVAVDRLFSLDLESLVARRDGSRLELRSSSAP